jgi:WD40 repeat protein
MAAVVQILPAQDGCYLVQGCNILYLQNQTDKVTVKYNGEKVLTRAAGLSADGTLLVACDVNKTIHLFRTVDFCELATGMLDKAAINATFAGDDILIADKFGDVIRFSKPDGPWRGTVIAGCISVSTDLIVTNRHVILADRDEKIRLIDRKFPVLIERFLLAHTEYVAAVRMLGDRLVSIGGDKLIILWDVDADEPVQTVSIEYVGLFDPVGLAVGKSIAYILNGVNKLFLLQITDDGIAIVPTELELPTGFKPVTLALEGDRFLISGLIEQQPVLLSVHGEAVSPVDGFTEISSTLSSESQPWSQLIRAHLRKQRDVDEQVSDED